MEHLEDESKKKVRYHMSAKDHLGQYSGTIVQYNRKPLLLCYLRDCNMFYIDLKFIWHAIKEGLIKLPASIT